ncbi:unnamed protein product [Caenorhabditis angaria]|uniref:Protein vav-1 n=1 Tax=Caenorhabditis angaria TaxID=860376 RepID=A0A9P1J1J1_9PELO|nr:unnamed protein product [Caenorhabditis angaria]
MTAGSKLWRGCARWLNDLGVLGTTDENGNLTEFASVLRDGVLLCRLANILVPNSIDQIDIIKNKHSQFTCTKNISNFLDFCRTKFGMKEEDLFTSADLFYMTGFQKCLNTLSILSHSPESLAKDVSPFPDSETPTNEQSPSSSFTQNGDDDIYQSLTDNIENVDPDTTIYAKLKGDDPEGQHNEQLYDHIVMARKSSMNEHDASPSVKRNKCMMELLDTEKNYVENALTKIIKHFYEPLKGIIPHDDYRVVFGNIENLLALHKLMLEDIRSVVSFSLGTPIDPPARPTSLMHLQDPPKYVGEVFVKFRDNLLEYGQYCSNLKESRETTNRLIETNDFIRKNIEDCQKFDKNQFSMQDLLSVPFQRITKYPLLIKELIKKTDPSSPEMSSLMDANEILVDICDYVNDMLRDTETLKCISEIEKSIVDLSMPANVRLKDYGRVNFDGEVKMAESTASQIGKTKPRYVFIFDKVLVICKSSNKNTNFTYKNAFVISELSVDMNVSIDTKTSGTITRRTQYVIHLHRDRTELNEIIHIAVYFKNESSRKKWLDAFILSKTNGSPTELIKDTNHKVTLTSFNPDVKHPEECGVCGKLMKGLYFQGYRCDHCHLSIHKDCLKIKRCEAVRRTSEPRNTQSFNTNRPRQSYTCGEIVVATSSFAPSDLSYLQFRKDDRIEVLQIHQNNKFTGCLVNNRSRTGLVNIDRVTRARTNSMIGLSPAGGQSPAGSIFPRLDRKESTVLPKKPDSLLSDGSQFSTAPRAASRSLTNGSTSGASSSSSNNRHQDYVNTEIAEFPWYMNEMERNVAESILRGTLNGTFLVRFSKNRNQYAISLSFKGDVRHMIVEQNKDEKVYLDEGYIFNSIVELVQYYRENNLIEIFASLDTTLKYPYQQCKMFKAIHDYEATHPAPDGKFLSLRVGDIVTLLDTVGEDRGWWKGQVNNQTGFFPLTYVEAINNFAKTVQDIKIV